MDLSGAAILTDAGALPAKYERIAEIINDYDPNLELRWIPPADRTVLDREPFAIWNTQFDYLVGTFREDEMDHRIIAHLFSINNANGSVLDRLEREEAARQALALKEQMDQQEEERAFMKSVIKSNKSVYRHNGVEYR